MTQLDTQTPPAAKNVTELPRSTAVPAPRLYSAFVPGLLVVLALVGWLAFQSWQMIDDRQQLAAVETRLGPQEQAAQKVRTSLEAVATATAKLASDGNANAQVVVEQLRKRGVTINAGAASKPQ